MTGGAAPRRKGSAWERDLVAFFRARGYDAERAYGAGRPDDVGDLAVGLWVPTLVEAKNCNATRRGEWLDEAHEKANRWRPGAIPILVEKRPQKPAGWGYVTMDLDSFVSLVEQVAERAR